MSTPEPSRVYALIPAGTDAPSRFALMRTVRRLADECGGAARALLAAPLSDTAMADARAAGLDAVWAAEPAGVDAQAPMQTHQAVDLLSAAIRAAQDLVSTGVTLLLLPAGGSGEAIAGALAARLNAVALGRCTALEPAAPGQWTVQRAAFGGRLQLTLDYGPGLYVATLRSPETAARDRPACTQAHRYACTVRPHYPARELPRHEPHAPLDGASVVVSGGRGMGGEAGFEALYALAQKLGGAVGGSLPAVDAGWVPVTRQVGLSGRYVSPRLYVAVGISGTPQHLAGIDPHTPIVAVNQDADAEIFKAAQVGVVADWREFLPALMRAIDDGTAALPERPER